MSEQLLKTPCAFGENGNFLLERELGSGGMGGVYMGRDKMLDRPVAVKVMLREYGADAEFVEKFKKEAQAAAKLIHPNIAQIYSYGISDGMPYIAMELVAGGSLWSLMQATPGKTEVTRVLKVCQQVAQALQCSTDQGFVHGDIKPENILLDANGNAKLVDFGLAGMQKDTSEIWGTPYYIAPEKVRQEGVDFRSDMYNLGGTLYHALTDKPPFDGPDVTAVVKARFTETPKKPSELRGDLTPAVDALVMRMLEQDKEKRFPSFEALTEEFKKVLTSGLEKKDGAATTPSTTGATGGKRVTTVRGGRRMTTLRRGTTVATPSKEEEEEEKGGNLGAKVFGVIVGVIVLIGLVGGGLYWYVASDKKSKAEQRQREIETGIAKARAALVDTRGMAEKYGVEFSEYAQKAVASCGKTSDELKRILPDWAAELARPQGTNAPIATADAERAKNRPAVIDDMQDLWGKAIECEQCVQRINLGVSNIVVVCAKGDQITGRDEKSMNALGDLSREAAGLYDALKTSKDVESVKKASGYIKQKGEKSVSKTVDRLRVEKIEAERKARKEAEAAAEKARLEAQATEKQQAVESEQAAAKAKFDSLVTSGIIGQLDWARSLGQLESLKKDEMKTPEGKLAVDAEINKVASMKMVQDIFIANLPDYTFKKSKLKGCKVRKVDAKGGIEMLKPDGKTPQKLSWKKFYTECHGNLNELINTFVVKGRENGKDKLNLKEWANAMCGAALSMRLLCGDSPTAVAYGETLVKQVAEAFPDYQKNLKAMFPDVALENKE